jgi:hypothetical protein
MKTGILAPLPILLLVAGCGGGGGGSRPASNGGSTSYTRADLAGAWSPTAIRTAAGASASCPGGHLTAAGGGDVACGDTTTLNADGTIAGLSGMSWNVTGQTLTINAGGSAPILDSVSLSGDQMTLTDANGSQFTFQR